MDDTAASGSRSRRYARAACGQLAMGCTVQHPTATSSRAPKVCMKAGAISAAEAVGKQVRVSPCKPHPIGVLQNGTLHNTEI